MVILRRQQPFLELPGGLLVQARASLRAARLSLYLIYYLIVYAPCIVFFMGSLDVSASYLSVKAFAIYIHIYCFIFHFFS